MANCCNGVAYIWGLKKEQKDRISRRAKNGSLCKQLIPFPKEVKEDLKMEDKYESEVQKLREKGWDENEFKKIKEKYPFKQLWYHWQYENRGSKWGLCDCDVEDTGPDSLELYFWTARNPVLPIFKKLSKKYHCTVGYEYDEPGIGFSGSIKWVDGNLVYDNHYDDAYFGEGVECVKCHGIYDGSTESDWANREKHICYNCGEEDLHN